MADIKFRISGNSDTYLATLCSNGVLQYKNVDSTCLEKTFGGLYPNTSYLLEVKDVVGNTAYCSITTPAQIGTTTLATKTLKLLGTPIKPQTSCVCTINSPKLVNINPILSVGESVDLFFQITTCNICTTNNGVTLYCQPNGSGSYVALSPSYLNSGSVPDTRCVKLCYGDSLCYDIYTSCNTIGHNICGCSILNLTSVVGYGLNATIDGSCCSLLTSINYTEPVIIPKAVGIYTFTNLSGHSCGSYYHNLIGQLSFNRSTIPSLSPTECFNLTFNSSISSCGVFSAVGVTRVICCGSIIALDNAISSSNIPMTCNKTYGPYLITCANVGNFQLDAGANIGDAIPGAFCVCSSLAVATITNIPGGGCFCVSQDSDRSEVAYYKH